MAPAQWLGVKNFENRDKRCEQKENGTIKEKNIKKQQPYYSAGVETTVMITQICKIWKEF